MAEISHVELPNGDLYDIKDYRLTDGAVLSVNGQTGDVVLDADDVGAVRENDSATDSHYGLVKTNSSHNITLNADGQLEVGDRLGTFEGTTGVFSPAYIVPANVGNGSFLITEASGTTLGAKELAVSTGIGLTLNSTAEAGSTTYLVKNTYANRISCAILAIEGGVMAVNEATADFTVPITSVTIGGSSYTPDSSADSNTPIVITTSESVNPTDTVSSVRCYPCEGGFSNIYVGQCVGGAGGASVVVGQRVGNISGNACALIGADIYNSGNGNGVFGRQHISRKNRWFISGTGHDNTNGKNESGAVFGDWSSISANTAFAIGNGTNATTRSNLFEITTDGGVILKDSNGKKWKITVNTTGTLTTTAVT